LAWRDVGAEVLEVILPALEVEPVEVGDLDVAEALDVGLDDALVFVLGGGFGLLGRKRSSQRPEWVVGVGSSAQSTERIQACSMWCWRSFGRCLSPPWR
jgi:hypothetical protein